MKKIGNIVRYSIGILFIIGMLGMASDSILAGMFMGLFGVSLFPIVYEKFIYSRFKFYKRSRLHIIIPVVLFIAMCIFMPETEVETIENNTVNKTVENEVAINEEILKDDENIEDKETTEENLIENETIEDVIKEQSKQEKQKEEITTVSIPVPVVTQQKEKETEQIKIPSPEPEQETKILEPTVNTISQKYILNNNTKKFHEESCGSASRIKDSNKSTFTGSRDELISRGYSSCGNCDP